jgi:hypothetical protein
MTRSLAILTGLVLGVVMHVPGSLCLSEELPVVAVARDTQFNEIRYRGTLSGCVVEWIVRDTEPAVVRQRSQGTMSLEQQLPLMRAVGAAFFHQDPHAGELRTLFWGRLTPDESRGGPQEMGFRLALAAFGSPGWDRVRGRPRDGDLNGFVRQLANEAMIYPELKALFAAFGRDITFASAEKVLVMRADGLPFYDRLQPHGVRGTDKLPFDCLTWFAVVER